MNKLPVLSLNKTDWLNGSTVHWNHAETRLTFTLLRNIHGALKGNHIGFLASLVTIDGNKQSQTNPIYLILHWWHLNYMCLSISNKRRLAKCSLYPLEGVISMIQPIIRDKNGCPTFHSAPKIFIFELHIFPTTTIVIIRQDIRCS